MKPDPVAGREFFTWFPSDSGDDNGRTMVTDCGTGALNLISEGGGKSDDYCSAIGFDGCLSGSEYQ